MEANYSIGEAFRIQFVWRIPSQDYLRAIFIATVEALDEVSMKYVVQLDQFAAGRQEDSSGHMRSLEEVDREYWSLVSALEGRRIAVAYESDDGRPLWLRLETLTGEHSFFRRLNELPEGFRKMVSEEQWETLQSLLDNINSG